MGDGSDGKGDSGSGGVVVTAVQQHAAPNGSCWKKKKKQSIAGSGEGAKVTAAMVAKVTAVVVVWCHMTLSQQHAVQNGTG